MDGNDQNELKTSAQFLSHFAHFIPYWVFIRGFPIFNLSFSFLWQFHNLAFCSGNNPHGLRPISLEVHSIKASKQR
jgi:hypothetical protein